MRRRMAERDAKRGSLLRGTFRPDALIALILAVGGWRTGLARLNDNSFFCHLRTGLWMLGHGVPRADPFSFTALGTPWTAESWLADLTYGLLDKHLGPFGISILTAATGAAIAGLWYPLALRLCRDRLRALAITLLSLGASWTLWSPRPLLLGILAFVCLVWIVEIPASRIGRHPLIAIPPLMWLWANIHGSFALGFAYLALHVAGRWMSGAPPWRGREKQIVVASVVGFAVCLLNPYGAGLVLAPLHLMARREVLSDVIEWQPPGVGVQGAMYLAWLVAFALCMITGRRHGSASDLLVCLPFLVAGLMAERNIAIAPLVTMPAAARAIAGPGGERSEERAVMNFALAAFIMVLAVWWTFKAARTPRFDFSSYPVRAMEAIESKGLLGMRLLNDDRWGDYIILRYWPRQYVFVDDRYDMYPVRILDDLSAMRSGHADWHDILKRYRIEVVIWPRAKTVEAAMDREPGWHRVYADRQAMVYARTD
jgi:hypothetical protein